MRQMELGVLQLIVHTMDCSISLQTPRNLIIYCCEKLEENWISIIIEWAVCYVKVFLQCYYLTISLDQIIILYQYVGDIVPSGVAGTGIKTNDKDITDILGPRGSGWTR